MARAYLSLAGLEGPCLDANHLGWIEILSFTWGETRSGARPGVHIPSAAKPQFQSVRMAKYPDRTSPTLMAKCARDSEFDHARIDIELASGTQPVFYRLRLVDCTLSSFKTTFEGDVIEELSLVFQRLEFGCAELRQDGSLDAMTYKAYSLATDDAYIPKPW